MQKQLEEARKDLDNAARKVADLSRRLGAINNEDVFVFRNRAAPEGRAMLGITMARSSDVNEDGEGIVVDGVTPGGPAAEAGIRAGDILTAIDDHSLKGDGFNSPAQKMRDYMSKVKAGDEVTLKYLRDNKKRTATFETGKFQRSGLGFRFGLDDLNLNDFPFVLSAPPAPDAPLPMVVEFTRHWGDMELVALTPRLGEYFGTNEGVLVVRSPREKTLQLEDGDVIVRIGARSPNSPRHAMRILRSYNSGEELQLEIYRDKKRKTLNVEIPENRVGARFGR
ncbi:MAG: PDZ domain-containing protein [Gammaproteobacteria bacterium]|nr:PDZ domain-containing protein [Gammaproteobacteria bacterium]